MKLAAVDERAKWCASSYKAARACASELLHIRALRRAYARKAEKESSQREKEIFPNGFSKAQVYATDASMARGLPRGLWMLLSRGPSFVPHGKVNPVAVVRAAAKAERALLWMERSGRANVDDEDEPEESDVDTSDDGREPSVSDAQAKNVAPTKRGTTPDGKTEASRPRVAPAGRDAVTPPIQPQQQGRSRSAGVSAVRGTSAKGSERRCTSSARYVSERESRCVNPEGRRGRA